MTKNGLFQYLKFWYFKTTLTILLKLSKMVDDNERDHSWKFQVQKKTGSFRRGPIISILADYDCTNCSGLSHNHVLPVSKASLWKIRPVSVKSVKIWPSTFDSVPRVPPRLGLLTLSRSLWDVTVLNFSWGQAWECYHSPWAPDLSNRSKDCLDFLHESSLL